MDEGLYDHPTLDFQLTDGLGTGDGNNAVTLSDFVFQGGGSWTGPASISMKDTMFFTESTQGFTPGSTLSFKVSMTTHVDAGGTPDQFSFGILDKNLSEVPTLGLGDALLSVNIDSANPAVQVFSSDPNRTAINLSPPNVAFGLVPDSGVPLIMMAGFWFLSLVWHRHQETVTTDA